MLFRSPPPPLPPAQIPVYAKANLRKSLDELGKRALAEQKAATKLVEEAGRVAVLAAAAEAAAAGRAFAAVEVPILGDGALVKAMGKALAGAPGDVALLGVSSNGKDKVRRSFRRGGLPLPHTPLLLAVSPPLR